MLLPPDLGKNPNTVILDNLSNGVPVRRLARIRSVPPLPDRHLPPLTPRQAAFLVQSLSDSLSADEQQLLSLLPQQPDVTPAIELVQNFARLVRQIFFLKISSYLRHFGISHPIYI